MEFIFLLTMSIDDVISTLVLRSIHLSRIWLKSNLESGSLWDILWKRIPGTLDYWINFSLKISVTSSLRYLHRNWDIIRLFATNSMCFDKTHLVCISPPLLIWPIHFLTNSLKNFSCIFSPPTLFTDFKKMRALDALILFGFSLKIFSCFLFIEKTINPIT